MAKKKTEQVAPKPEEKAPEAVISFEDFLQGHKIHPGLIASFKYEAQASEAGLLPRTEGEWVADFEEQSNRTY